MKYKVGDLVRVDVHDLAENFQWAYDTNGKTYKVTKVVNSERTYFLDDGHGYAYSELWLHPAKDFIQICIDASDPKSAHAAVSKACKDWKNRQLDWTEEEIQEAKRLSNEMLLELFHDGDSPVFLHDPCTKEPYIVEMKLVGWEGAYGKPYYAKCRGKDIPNADIGECVCFCKATGRKIPEFIKNKNR